MKLIQEHYERKRSGKYTKWFNLYECVCGKQVINIPWLINSGKVRSCGCLRNESTPKRKLAGLNSRKPEGESSRNQLYLNYKNTAKRRKIEWNLSKEDFNVITKDICYYCGIKPSQILLNGKCHSGAYLYNGIDRYDNTKGYILENCKPCCVNCNFAKRTMTAEDYIRHCSLVASRWQSVLPEALSEIVGLGVTQAEGFSPATNKLISRYAKPKPIDPAGPPVL